MFIMTWKNKLILGLLLLLSQHCLTQNTAGVTGGSGYQYGRADANTANLPNTPTPTGLRPIIPVSPTSFGTAPTGFGPGFGQAQRPAVAPVPVNTAVGFSPSSSAVGLQTGGYSGATVGRGGISNRPITTPQTYRSGQRNDGLTGSGTGGTGFDANYDDNDGDFSAIPGVPGVNYPVYSQVPRTSFDCRQQPLPGYYSDVEAQCQVFHICALNRTYSFLCPNGTLFSQESLVCVWWNQFDCGLAPALYPNNAFIYDYGNDRTASNSGFVAGTQQQTNARQTSNFPITGSGSRTSNSNIYGTGTNIRPTVGGSTFTSVAPVQQTGYQTTATAAGGRFAPATSLRNNNAQIFPIGSTSTLPFGAVIPPAGNDKISGTANTGFSGIQDTAFTNTNAAVAPSATNREYLPPRRP